MSAAAIKAGKAWIELALKDKTDSGLAAVKKKFLRWGTGLAAAGTAVATAAGGILAALTSAAKAFADAGSEVYDLSRATGASAEELSALTYAAEQSGASVSDVANAFKGLSKFAGDVTRGTKASTQALQQLGLSGKDFLAATPYQRLLLVADALQRIPDPGLRSAVAMQVLGRSAMTLGSLLAGGAKGVQDLVAEAQRLGLVVTQAEADQADALGDAWDAVGKQLKQVGFVIGSAVAPLLTELLTALQPVIAEVIAFIRHNKGLVVGLTIATAAIGGLGVAIAALGTALLAAGLAIAYFPAALAAIGAVLGAVFSPIGLIIGGLVTLGVALVAGAGYWLFWTESGKAAVKAVMDYFQPLVSFVAGVMGGIWDAIAEGNWQLAGEIMMAALNVAWQTGIVALKTLWEDFRVWLVSFFADLATMAIRKTEDTFAAVQAYLPFDIMGNLSGAGDVSEAAAALVKKSASNQRNANLAPLQAKLLKAAADLAALIARAKSAREKSAAGLATPGVPQGSALAELGPMDGGKAAGTFNAAIAGLLANSGESIAERTAKAAERTADATEAIEREMEDFGKDEE
jgi:hypothetical protein